MSVSEIRTMRDNEALYVYANKKPLVLNMKPYYKDRKYTSYTNLPPFKGDDLSHYDNIHYVDLKNIDWGDLK